MRRGIGIDCFIITRANFIALCLLVLLLETNAQKNGFRGGSKSYEVHVEASSMGTNLHYELPEAKVKSASKQDWLVDNDNAEMTALNSPVLATVTVKHPKFSMKGQWPGYKTNIKLPKDVEVASRRHDLTKTNQEGNKLRQGIWNEQDDESSGSAQTPEDQRTMGDQKDSEHGFGSGSIFSKVAGQFLKNRESGKERHSKGSLEIPKELDQHEETLVSAQTPDDQRTISDQKDSEHDFGSGSIFSKVAGQFLKNRKSGKDRHSKGSLEILKVSGLLLPLAGLKNVDLENPRVKVAMKGIVKHARKVVNEAKTVLSDAANFITRVRKLVRANTLGQQPAKDPIQSKGGNERATLKALEQIALAGATHARGADKTAGTVGEVAERFSAHATKTPAFVSQIKNRHSHKILKNEGLNGERSASSDRESEGAIHVNVGQGNSGEKKVRQGLHREVARMKTGKTTQLQGESTGEKSSGEKKSSKKINSAPIRKDISIMSDKGLVRGARGSGSTSQHTARDKRESNSKRRKGLPDTLESILFTIRGLKSLLKYK